MDDAKFGVCGLLYTTSFPWKLLPFSCFKPSSYSIPSLQCLLYKKPRTAADLETGFRTVLGFLLSGSLPLPLSPCNIQNYSKKNPCLHSEQLSVREQELLLSLLMQRYPRKAQPGHKRALGKQRQALPQDSNCTALYSHFQRRSGLCYLFCSYLLSCANTNAASGFYFQTVIVPFVSSCFFILHCKSAVSISSSITPVHFLWLLWFQDCYFRK